MTAFRTTTMAFRTLSVLAAASLTGLLLGGQLLIADRYTQQPDEQMAARAVQPAAPARVADVEASG